MQLVYFDENKYTDENPYFFVGGIIVDASKSLAIESTLSQIQYNFFQTNTLIKDNEFHGKDIFHGKGNFKNKKLSERIKLLDDLTTAIINNKLPIRLVCINVNKHRKKYVYPMP